MKLKLFQLLFSISTLSIAQDGQIEIPVSKADLTENFYEKDSTDSALVTYDHGNSFIDKKSFWLWIQIK